MGDEYARDVDAPTTLAISAYRKPKPTAHVVLAIPRADSDTIVDLQYYTPEEADKAHASKGQSRFVTPSGAVFLFRSAPAPKPSSKRSARF
jgi:hypothetical protein